MSTMAIRDRLLAAFQSEHRQHTDAVRAFLAEIESESREATEPELDEAFRRAHSLKAGARVCDLEAVETLSQRLESLFSRPAKVIWLWTRIRCSSHVGP